MFLENILFYIFKNREMKIIFRETCVLMGSFGKYMVFKAQLYEI